MDTGIRTAGAIHLDRATQHGLECAPHLASHGTLGGLFSIAGKVGTAIAELHDHGSGRLELALHVFRHMRLLVNT